MMMTMTDRKIVDFADFHIEGVYNRKTAGELSAILMAHVNIDEIAFNNNDDLPYNFPTTVGTGGNDEPYHVMTQGQQRAMLACHLASFAYQQYNSCYLALPEYYCLKELYNWLKDDYCLEDKIEDQLTVLKKVLSEFERAYVRIDKNFLFEILQN